GGEDGGQGDAGAAHAQLVHQLPAGGVFFGQVGLEKYHAVLADRIERAGIVIYSAFDVFAVKTPRGGEIDQHDLVGRPRIGQRGRSKRNPFGGGRWSAAPRAGARSQGVGQSQGQHQS